MAKLDSRDVLLLAVKALIGSIPGLGPVNVAIFDTMSLLQLKELKAVLEVCSARIASIENNENYWPVRDQLNTLFRSTTAKSLQTWQAEFAESAECLILTELERHHDAVVSKASTRELLHRHALSQQLQLVPDIPWLVPMLPLTSLPATVERGFRYLVEVGTVLIFNPLSDTPKAMIHPNAIEFVRANLPGERD